MSRQLYRCIEGLGVDLVCTAVRKPHLEKTYEFISENFGISYIAEGTNHYRFNGEDCFFPQGTVFANFRNELIGEPRDPDYPSTRYFLSIRGTGAENLLRTAGFSPESRSVQLPRNSRAPSLLHEMFEDFLAHAQRTPQIGLQRFFRILDTLRCHLRKDSPSTPPSFCRRIEELFSEEDYRSLGANEIARTLGLSPRKLLYAVRAEHNLSAAAFLNHLRIGFACRLLRETDFKLASIARTCGFSGERYFMTKFRQKTGCTPSQYRRQSAALPKNTSLLSPRYTSQTTIDLKTPTGSELTAIA